MTDALIYKLVDLAFNALAVGLERDLILTKVKEMESSGATPEQVAEALRGMRDQAIQKAQEAIDGK